MPDKSKKTVKSNAKKQQMNLFGEFLEHVLGFLRNQST